VIAHHMIEALGETIARSSPGTNVNQPDRSSLIEFVRVEVLVSDRVPPDIQSLKEVSSTWILWAMLVDVIPELHSQSIEVRSDIPRSRVPLVQLPAEDELGSQNHLQSSRGDCPCDMVNRFRMEVATKPLEMRREQYDVGMVELLCRESATTTCAPYAHVSGYYLIQLC